MINVCLLMLIVCVHAFATALANGEQPGKYVLDQGQ